MTDETKKYTPEERSRDAIRAVMSTRPGRRFVYERLMESGFLQAILPADAATMGFNAGQQNRALALFATVDSHSPNETQLMFKEAKEDEAYDREQQRRLAAESNGGAALDEFTDNHPIEH